MQQKTWRSAHFPHWSAPEHSIILVRGAKIHNYAFIIISFSIL